MLRWLKGSRPEQVEKAGAPAAPEGAGSRNREPSLFIRLWGLVDTNHFREFSPSWPSATPRPFLPSPWPGGYKCGRRCSEAGEPSSVGGHTSGVGGHTGQPDSHPGPCQGPLPRRDGISTAEESPGGWTQRPCGWPRGFGVRFCVTGKLVAMPQAPHVTSKSTQCWACLGDDRKCA